MLAAASAGLVLEALLEPADGGRAVALEHPVDQPERVEVLAAQLLARGQAGVAGRGLGVGARCRPRSPGRRRGVPSWRGSAARPAFCRLRSSKLPSSRTTMPPGLSSRRLTLSAAGLSATSTSGAVADRCRSRRAPKLIWKAETPKVVPTGARISAGKSGKVSRSLPARAVAWVNWAPVSWMPSPLSPAKRTTANLQLLAPARAGAASIMIHGRSPPTRRPIASVLLARPGALIQIILQVEAKLVTISYTIA